MTEQISEKSTKTQILQAYNEALAKLKEAKQEDRKSEKKKEEEGKIVKQASEYSVERIVNNIGSAKIEIISALDKISEKLTAEYKKLEMLQKACELESNYLKDVYDIKVEADTLSALLLTQKEKKLSFELEIEKKQNEFDEEISRKKFQWKLEQESYENQRKERDAQLKKEREREEDEYNYNLQLRRKKEVDEYNERKSKLEKELVDMRVEAEKDLSQRELIVASREKEFAELKLKLEQFPGELQKAVTVTEKAVLEKVEFKYKHQSELSQKEIEGERNLNKQKILSLENKIEEQAELIKQLTQKVNDSGQQVQTIAIKAIEATAGSSTAQRFFVQSEKQIEQQLKGKE
jgi:hypothetical protein